MDISKLNNLAIWKAEVMIFSGRPNPSWKVPKKLSDEILFTFSEAKKIGIKEENNQLGYNGVVLKSENYILKIVNEAFFLYQNGILVEKRIDKQRNSELKILSSAPKIYHELLKSIR